jgi:hypothetical protein
LNNIQSSAQRLLSFLTTAAYGFGYAPPLIPYRKTGLLT